MVKQAPPNDGVLNTVGMLGIPGEGVAFDIVSDGNGANEGWLMAGETLYKVDFASGKASALGKIAGTAGLMVRDIAAMPRT